MRLTGNKMNKLNIISKRYWNRQPCNLNHSKKKFLSKEYFNEISKKRYFVESHIKKFVNFKNYKNKNVLEIGFGIGTDAIEFLKNGAKYNGIELSNKSYDITKKRIELFNYSKKSILVNDEAENLLNYFTSKNNFHLIYSFGVLHHSSSLSKCLNIIYKLMNNNTICKIMLYAKNSYKYFLMNENLIRYEAQKGVPVIDFYNQSDIKIIFKKFKIINIEQDFIFPYEIKPYKKNKYVKIDHFKYMNKKIFKTLSKNLGEHLLITLKK
tara:strand:- start:347 stop:1147 length:801 start_codon:yes stop_codon:yes gene_type:complete